MSTQRTGFLQIQISPEAHTLLWERLKNERKKWGKDLTIADVAEYYLWIGMSVQVTQ